MEDYAWARPASGQEALATILEGLCPSLLTLPVDLSRYSEEVGLLHDPEEP